MDSAVYTGNPFYFSLFVNCQGEEYGKKSNKIVESDQLVIKKEVRVFMNYKPIIIFNLIFNIL